MRILIIEDEKKVARFIVQGLQELGYTVDVRHDGEAGLQQALSVDYVLIILDVMLPGKDGFSVLAELRASACNSRVLLLSALNQSQHKVKGLNLGADDYLAKPFDFDELLARVNALLRRGNYKAREVLEAGDLRLDSRSLLVERGGMRIELTKREFLLLKFMLEHKDEIVTRKMIAENVWNLSLDAGTNVIDVYINYLRRKIDDGFTGKLLHTVRGQGYILSEKE